MEDLTNELQHSCGQRRNALTHELEYSTMEKAGDPFVYTIRPSQLKDELEVIGGLVTEARLTTIVLKGIIDVYCMRPREARK